MTAPAATAEPAHGRAAHRAERKVTWLELFFDLVFVAAVAQVAEPLREHYSFGELARLTPLLLLVWWAWTGRTFFTTRFDRDDALHRVLTLLEMFAIAVMAANGRDALDSRSSAGFAAAYAGVRVILVIRYLRVGGSNGCGLTRSYLLGHGSAAALWLVSALLPVEARLAAWVLAFAVDLGTPWAALDHSVRLPPHPAHLPERFGLFTLILLGESVVAVMKGIESQETWSVPAASSALFGIAVLFLIWWWYFDRARATDAHHVRSRSDALRLHAWSYAHFPLYLGIVIAGVGIQRLVSTANNDGITRGDFALWLLATVLIVASMTIIGAAARQGRRAVTDDASGLPAVATPA